jgi:hypothetical protein
MSTKFIHYLPSILNHCHDLQVFYGKLARFQTSTHLPTIADRRLLKEVTRHDVSSLRVIAAVPNAWWPRSVVFRRSPILPLRAHTR